MNKIRIKRTNQFYVVNSQIRININGNDYGAISNGELKIIEIEQDEVVIKFESSTKNLELALRLNVENDIEIYWSRAWGNIGFKDPGKIVLRKQRKINWKNYLLALFLFIAILFIISLLLA